MVKTKSGEEGNKSETYIRNEGSKEVVWGNQFTLRPRDHWWNSGTKTRMQRKTRKTRTRKITRTKRRRTKHTSRQREITRNRNTQSHTCTCGKNNFIHNGEISGGEIAIPNEFPWVVRIYGGCSGGISLDTKPDLYVLYCINSIHKAFYQYIFLLAKAPTVLGFFL